MLVHAANSILQTALAFRAAVSILPTALAIRGLEIALVYPRVGAVLDPTEDWHSPVISSCIFHVGVIV